MSSIHSCTQFLQIFSKKEKEISSCSHFHQNCSSKTFFLTDQTFSFTISLNHETNGWNGTSFSKNQSLTKEWLSEKYSFQLKIQKCACFSCKLLLSIHSTFCYLEKQELLKHAAWRVSLTIYRMKSGIKAQWSSQLQLMQCKQLITSWTKLIRLRWEFMVQSTKD